MVRYDNEANMLEQSDSGFVHRFSCGKKSLQVINVITVFHDRLKLLPRELDVCNVESLTEHQCRSITALTAIHDEDMVLCLCNGCTACAFLIASAIGLPFPPINHLHTCNHLSIQIMNILPVEESQSLWKTL